VAEGGYQCGEKTRARIIDAAITLFGELGFDGASTRDIAALASVNPPALRYYFNNKEGVYRACVKHIVSAVSAHVVDSLEAAEEKLAANAGDEVLIDAFRAIQRDLASYLFASAVPSNWRLFTIREQAGLGLKFNAEQGVDPAQTRILTVSASVISRLCGLPANHPESIIRAFTINAQLISFHVTRQSAMTALTWDSIGGERLAQLLAITDDQTVTLLRALVSARNASQGLQTKRTGFNRCVT